MDAASWISYYDYEGAQTLPMPLLLVDGGHDVWMGSNRGTKYSNINPNFPLADDSTKGAEYLKQAKEKYAFSFDEMGNKDLPAMIDQILKVSTQPKITYIGYSQGTTQMVAGLARQEESYFASRVDKAILLAPCLYPAQAAPVEFYNAVFPELYRLGVYNAFDKDWATKVTRVCSNSNETACSFVRDGLMVAEGTSIHALDHFYQIAVTDRFQGYIPDFGAERVSREGALLPIGTIDKVPIQLVVFENDEVCPASFA